MDQLEEAIQCVRGLLRDDVTDVRRARGSSSRDARCEPKPVQAELPIWVGGSGEKRTLRIAAQWADGWNVPFVDPETFARKRDVLHQHCDDGRPRPGRDPHRRQRRAWPGPRRACSQQFGGLADFVRPGVLTGSDEEVIDRIGRYVEAGADQVNLALRAPFDEDALDRFAAALGLS